MRGNSEGMGQGHGFAGGTAGRGDRKTGGKRDSGTFNAPGLNGYRADGGKGTARRTMSEGSRRNGETFRNSIGSVRRGTIGFPGRSEGDCLESRGIRFERSGGKRHRGRAFENFPYRIDNASRMSLRRTQTQNGRKRNRRFWKRYAERNESGKTEIPPRREIGARKGEGWACETTRT